MTFDPKGACGCTKNHAPQPVVVETHHVVPLSWGGPDEDANKIRLCPTAHYNTHALLNLYVHANGRPDHGKLRPFSLYVRHLAARAWSEKPANHPTPYWLIDPAPGGHTH